MSPILKIQILAIIFCGSIKVYTELIYSRRIVLAQIVYKIL